MNEQSAFLYSDARFRTLGQSRVKLPLTAQLALDAAHRRIVENPDAQIVCCLCGNRDDIRVSCGDRHGLPVSLVLCRSCGLIRANPQPSREQLEWFYSKIYRSLYGPFGADDSALFEGKRWKGQLVLDALRASGTSLPAGPVVDLGCGGGWTLAAFSEAGHSCIGFDFDPGLLALGKRRGLDLRLGGAEQARHAQVHAALLIFGHVLEHVPDPEAELHQLRPLLQDSGLLYLEVPHTRRIGGAALRCDSLGYWQRAHLWDFQASHLTALAERAGYEVLWASQDDSSAFLLCRTTDKPAPSSWPRIGPQVEAQLVAFEARYQSRSRKLVEVAKQAFKKRSGQLRRFLGS